MEISGSGGEHNHIRVQSLSQNGKGQVPPQYIQVPECRPAGGGGGGKSIPVIDLGGGGSVKAEMRTVGVCFFEDCPMAEKLKYSCDSNTSSFASQGYGSRMLVSSNDAVLDWRDYFDHHTLPLSRRNPSLWPHFPSNYSFSPIESLRSSEHLQRRNLLNYSTVVWDEPSPTPPLRWHCPTKIDKWVMSVMLDDAPGKSGHKEVPFPATWKSKVLELITSFQIVYLELDFPSCPGRTEEGPFEAWCTSMVWPNKYNILEIKSVYDITQQNAQNREIIVEYSAHMKALAQMLLSLMSESLGLPSSRIEEVVGEFYQNITVSYYPPCPQPELTLGLQAHSDMGAITLLIQDDVGGLQVLKDGEWINVHPFSDAIVVILADQTEIYLVSGNISVETGLIDLLNSIKNNVHYLDYVIPDSDG
ncbi:2-oxoglutarate (2OG) and Fe(II)-dependent oxygenase superfamily protein [Actinidia rufa]|uniref:2-oxoglutarate (2OG) and Fe(II)-dependent oxygenase superfamily protein n=1 Tax=Actinidia rufa TaxID=165716 RepID=A0A7J0DYG5_9ERIC|nr:2-oxoglutarate (2OG) and Fe(II)-dependent oxygenase superfamily protein [Actinidia rufa]